MTYNSNEIRLSDNHRIVGLDGEEWLIDSFCRENRVGTTAWINSNIVPFIVRLAPAVTGMLDWLVPAWGKTTWNAMELLQSGQLLRLLLTSMGNLGVKFAGKTSGMTDVFFNTASTTLVSESWALISAAKERRSAVGKNMAV
jgi:hypothetical protein